MVPRFRKCGECRNRAFSPSTGRLFLGKNARGETCKNLSGERDRCCFYVNLKFLFLQTEDTTKRSLISINIRGLTRKGGSF